MTTSNWRTSQTALITLSRHNIHSLAVFLVKEGTSVHQLPTCLTVLLWGTLALTYWSTKSCFLILYHTSDLTYFKSANFICVSQCKKHTYITYTSYS